MTGRARPKVALVSTYDRLCGIAAYAKVLREQVSDFCDVEIVRLDADLLQRRDKAGLAAGDAHIRDITMRLGAFDLVNIHLEHGLYGAERSAIYRRLMWLFDAAPALCLTIHWLVPRPSGVLSGALGAIARGDPGSLMRELDHPFNYLMMGKALYATLRQYQALKQVSIVVHTRADRRRMEQEYGLSNVHDHPLAYLAPETVQAVRQRASRAHFAPLDTLPDYARIAGVFGFMSPYKGFETAIEAMRMLGPEDHLAIFGGAHPSAPAAALNYEAQLRRAALDAPELAGRIHFCGTLGDVAFLEAMVICDCVVMPYREVGLSSSGPISQAIELGARVLASRTRAFTALADYYPDQIEFFGIGNARELAERIAAPRLARSGPESLAPLARATYRKAFAIAGSDDSEADTLP